ncbi:hypothetical protein BA763_07210 [Burkholderia cenocepacia]|nr:hypothetical protein BA763_07210 [Burkholderia cenocepacia]
MKFDVAIVGSGLAGLSVALNLASTRRVALIAKRSMMEGASDNAQGGIAAVQLVFDRVGKRHGVYPPLIPGNLKIRRIAATDVIHLIRLSFETNFQCVGRIAGEPRRAGPRSG